MSDSHEDTQAVTKAMEAGKTYFKEKYDLNVEFTHHKFNPPDLGTDVGLYGHLTDDTNTEVFILMNYETLEVLTAGVPKELIEKQES
ncbi:hypothetical protein [Paenibacillus sp. An7]|uniref:hypothetical protein n=1 Tax=Paenibacillus sp. An7 TaxID=2689577 RepID=UPI00135A13A0|nr:hypothetical protein [Paenibacillus sp. An7]